MFFHENVGMHCLLYDSLIWNETPTKVSNGFRAYRLLNDGRDTTLYKYYYICLIFSNLIRFYVEFYLFVKFER